MKSIPFTFLIVFCVAIWEFGSTNTVAMSCDSCGAECARACGTRHFRSCCFNYVKKRSSSFHPHSLNQLRYELLYRQLPYGSKQSKLQSKSKPEQQPRQEIAPSNVGSSQNEVSRGDENLKPYFKLLKQDPSLIDDDYDELRRASEPVQQLIYDA